MGTNMGTTEVLEWCKNCNKEHTGMCEYVCPTIWTIKMGPPRPDEGTIYESNSPMCMGCAGCALEYWCWSVE